MTDHEFITHCMDAFADIGRCDTGGYTRLGYTETEDEMHQTLAALATAFGLKSFADSAGNTIVCTDGQQTEPYDLIGSHLDSVPNGGNYDGVSGVAAGLWVLWKSVQDQSSLPLRVIAFRCEESAGFNVCMLGSSLFVGAFLQEDISAVRNREGTMLADVFSRRGYSVRRQDSDPALTDIRRYLELHIEQGRILESQGQQIGLVTSIAGCRRAYVTIQGVAEHSGATPMGIRADALCAAAELVLGVEQLGRREARYGSVATVGVLDNYPNAINTVPGKVVLSVDMRGNDTDSLDRMQLDLDARVKQLATQRQVSYVTEPAHGLEPVLLNETMLDGLEQACKAEGCKNMRMMSGAGHDAAVMAGVIPAGMLFIPCRQGVSHNPAERADNEDILRGAQVLYRYLRTTKHHHCF